MNPRGPSATSTGAVMAWRTLCVALSVLLASSIAQLQQNPQVTTSLGKLQGTVRQSISGREIYAFEGIPFAKPPVGQHRFKRAVPNDPWTGILHATQVPNICMQLQFKEFKLINSSSDVIGSEDCLYLNVYTPKLQPDGKQLNVIVQIHGGGYQLGFSHMAGPSFLLDRDVVLVTINYRLGLLGFLSFEDSVVPGNNGLKDQVLALQWVNKHISAFGGDPNKVTISGVSAGGAAVDSLLLSPLSKGLFQKAISNSGSELNPWAMTREPRKLGFLIAEAVGCPTTDTKVTLKCMRERSAEQLVGSVQLLSGFVFPFAPVVEPPSSEAFMDKHPVDMIKSKAGSDVPALFSYAISEGQSFLMKPFFDIDHVDEFDKSWNEKIPGLAIYDGLLDPEREKEVSQSLRNRFIGDGKLSDNLKGLAKLMSERYFDDGIQKSCLLRAQHQESPVYSYRFNFPRPPAAEAIMQKLFGSMFEASSTHGEDTFYVFDTPMFPMQDGPEARALSKTFIDDIWMTFIEGNQVANWSTVDSKLPQFTFLEVKGSNPKENVFTSEVSVGQSFWNALNIPLQAKSAKSAAHTEL
ncbi:hypothetical protein GE061_001994 [Apolygus lucorum]|uniref:Carboxylic ester hydrolase n=1 Tax=Apolygus lucorum TaxID=248454 RepID=A0A8S9X3U4_APOLU|nr:hypothetical protein GE061_001994 [Apolygus lucorum]